MFQASDDFITFDHRPGEKTFWKASALKRMKGRGDFTEDCAFYSLEDGNRTEEGLPSAICFSHLHDQLNPENLPQECEPQMI